MSSLISPPGRPPRTASPARRAEATGPAMRWQQHHTVWAVLGLGSVANTVFRRGLGPVLLPLRDAFGLSYSEVGLVAFVPTLSYALVQAPSGHLGDRLGRGRVLLAGSLLWGAATALAAAAPSFAGLLVLLALAGIGEGTLFGNDRPLVAIHTPPERQGIGQAISFGAGGVGTWIGVLAAGVVAEAAGWRYVFLVFAAPVFLFAWAVRRWICPLPEPVAPGGAAGTRPRSVAWRAMATPRLLTMYGSGAAITFTTWFLGTWGPALFLDAGVSGLRDASALASLFGLAMIAGLPATALLGDRLTLPRDRARLLAALLALAGGLVTGLGWSISYEPEPAALLGLAMAVVAIASGCWPLLSVFLSAEAPPARLGLTYGLANGLWQGGALAAPLIGGWLRDTTASFAGGCYLAAALLGATAASVLMAYRRTAGKEGG